MTSRSDISYSKTQTFLIKGGKQAMKYHEDYDLEMTESERKYHERLKKFDELKASADDLYNMVIYTRRTMSDCRLAETFEHFLINCVLEDDVLEFSVKIYSREFKHCNLKDAALNITLFALWIIDISDQELSSDKPLEQKLADAFKKEYLANLLNKYASFLGL